MTKRRRDDTVINHKKRPLDKGVDKIEHKKTKGFEYWHHKELSREARAAEMAAMYIHLLNLKQTS
jgi:hypothetical protein